MHNASPSRRPFLVWLTFCFLGVSLSGQAQSPGSLSHQAWSTEEGLPASAVHQILQSKDGYIWLATEGGAVRFDGVTFTTFRHASEPAFADSDVTAIAEDTSGNLWFGTSEGLTEYRAGTFLRIPSAMSSPAILSLAASQDGPLLALTADGLVEIEDGSIRRLTDQPADAMRMEAAANGTVLVLTQGGVFRYEQRRLVPESLPFRTSEPLHGSELGPGGVQWAWSSKTVFEAGPRGGREWSAGEELPAGRLTDLLVDRSGLAWIGTTHGLYTVSSGQTASVAAVDALRGESIASIFQDREGNVWIGTEGSGLHVLRPRAFRNEATVAGEAVTTVITASDGKLWFGTRGEGLHALAPEVLQTPVSAAALTSPIILSMAPGSSGDVWAGTPDGLNHIEGKRVEQFTSANGLPDDFVRSVAVDGHGAVWAGTRRGLVHLDHGQVRTWTAADGLGSDSIGPLLLMPVVRAREKKEEELWIGTSAGLSMLAGNEVRSYAPDLPSGRSIVTALASDGGAGLWMGIHQGGLVYFRNEHFRRVVIPALPEEIVSVLLDRRGFLWLRGLNAIYRVRQSDAIVCAESAQPCATSVATFGAIDGMPSAALAGEGTPAAWEAKDGTLWFATRTGLAAGNLSQMVSNEAPPPVVIEHFRVDETDMPTDGSESQIGPGHNRYLFDFAALSFTAPSKNRYRYMLEGFDRTWIDAVASRTASYTSLPARRYVFRVQAANSDGVWNRTGASVSFRVLPPIYRRWWFYLLALMFTAGIAFAVYRLRVHSIERRFALVLKERNRVAREVHDTLAQDFVSVSLQLDITSSLLKAKQFDEAGSQLQTTRQLVKKGLEEARQSIWNLRASTAEDSLPARLTSLVKRSNRPGAQLRLKMGGAYRRVPPTIENEVFRIAQESLSNVQRHAAATEATVELHYEATALRLTVRDNGRGFSSEAAEQLQGHYGLRGMRERASTIDGTFTIQSEPGAGTSVTLIVSLPEREGAQI